jgi:hypothetical protein
MNNVSRVSIKLGLPTIKQSNSPILGSDDMPIYGISVLSINLHGYGNINYGSTVVKLNQKSDPHTTSLIQLVQYFTTGRGNGVPLFAVRIDPQTGERLIPTQCEPLTIMIPYGVSSFEIVAMVWVTKTGQVEFYSPQFWIAVWHIDLVNLSITAISWTRVLSENVTDICTNESEYDESNVTVNDNQYMEAILECSYNPDSNRRSKSNSNLRNIQRVTPTTYTVTLFSMSEKSS